VELRQNREAMVLGTASEIEDGHRRVVRQVDDDLALRLRIVEALEAKADAADPLLARRERRVRNDRARSDKVAELRLPVAHDLRPEPLDIVDHARQRSDRHAREPPAQLLET